VTRGMTLDTGALIALERGAKRMRVQIKVASETGTRITVPAPVLIEWWRAGFGRRHEEILARCTSSRPRLASPRLLVPRLPRFTRQSSTPR